MGVTSLILAACPGTHNVYIQHPTHNANYTSSGAVNTLWAIAEPQGIGCEEDDYWFRLVNVTDSTTVICQNANCSQNNVVFDSIDQWSWNKPTVTWYGNKTYRLEFYVKESASPIDCVTFTTDW